MATLEGEWTTVHCITIEDTVGIDVGIHGANMHPYSKVVFHMREAMLVGSLGTTFNSYAWRGRTNILGTILCYPEAILANIQTIVQRDKALDSLGMR